MVNCIKCNKCIKCIGKNRTNGKGNYYDWETRKLHKKCWLELKQYQNFILFNYNDDELKNQMLKNYKEMYGLNKLL
jgi:hypothetical protein